MPPVDNSVRIPADVETPDKILAGLTARQLAILAGAGVALWLAYTATDGVLPFPVFMMAAVPVGAVAAVVALGRRDGLGLDELLLAAVRHARSPRRLVRAPEGVAPPPAWAEEKAQPLPAPLRLPADAISADGVVDLGADGVAVVCAASTVSFALRTPEEQASLVGVFGRWLNSLSGPAQIVVRAQDVNLTPLISALREHAPSLPHPELEQAAIEHAGFLASLAQRRDLLRRQVLVVIREPCRGGASDRAAAQRVLRRADEAAAALASAYIHVQVLPGGQAAAVLAACCDPWRRVPSAALTGRAAPTDVIVASGEQG
jgi:hypothetical protein